MSGNKKIMSRGFFPTFYISLSCPKTVHSVLSGWLRWTCGILILIQSLTIPYSNQLQPKKNLKPYYQRTMWLLADIPNWEKPSSLLKLTDLWGLKEGQRRNKENYSWSPNMLRIQRLSDISSVTAQHCSTVLLNSVRVAFLPPRPPFSATPHSKPITSIILCPFQLPSVSPTA